MQKKFKNTNKKMIAIGLASSLSLLAVASIGAQKAHAIAVSPTYVDSFSGTTFQLPQDTVGASFSWGKVGNTDVKIEKGSQVSTALTAFPAGKYAPDGTHWGKTNEPHADKPLYSVNNGDSYRISNVGKTTDNRNLDIIITVKSSVNSPSYSGPTGVSFYNSSEVGSTSDHGASSIVLLVAGKQSLTTNVKYVYAGTNASATVGTGMFWSDIDIQQGVNETQSNNKAYFLKNQPSTDPLSIDGSTVYSTTGTDINGYSDADAKGGTYLGLGIGNNFDITYSNPYTGGKNSFLRGQEGSWTIFRYDLFGSYNNLVLPPAIVSRTSKTVSDIDQKNVVDNSLSLKERSYDYNISGKVTTGSAFTSLVFNDNLPDSDTIDSTDNIKILNSAKKDVTSYFDLSLKNNNQITATLKKDYFNSDDVKNTTLNVSLTNVKTTKDWGEATLINKATWTSNGSLTQTTNEVTTHVPTAPKATKSVSVDTGTTKDTDKKYVAADSEETAAQMTSRNQDYTWKNDFTLSNRTNFTNIELVDNFENIQALDTSKIHVYDTSGNDVTKDGNITTTNSNGKVVVNWKATSDYINTVNSAFGRSSNQAPKFTMYITTNISNATKAQQNNYYNASLGKTIIPNVSSLIEQDNSGTVTTDTNKSHVTPPNPTAPSLSKQVAIDGTDPFSDSGWSQSLALTNHDQMYSYRSIFNLSKNFKFDGNDLVLQDNFENLQSYNNVKLYDVVTTSGKTTYTDISDKFDFKALKNGNTTSIVATNKVDTGDYLGDSGKTLYMVIKGATLTGATGSQESNYLEPHTKSGGLTATEDAFQSDPFVEGVTIPNISQMKETSPATSDGKNPFTYQNTSNTTFVNILIGNSISKFVEETPELDKIIDPDKATTDVDNVANTTDDNVKKEDAAYKEALTNSNKLIDELNKLPKLTSQQKEYLSDLILAMNDKSSTSKTIIDINNKIQASLK